MAAGAPFGKYLLIKRLGAGGAAEVFLAREASAPRGRPVAIKRILPAYSRDRELARMMLEEGRLCAQLAHPGLVDVQDVGKAEGLLYFAMEYVHGVTLVELLDTLRRKARPFPWPLAVRIGAALCETLEYAHGAVDVEGRPLGLIHRDVSPSNVMLSWVGGVKLLDFGIAAALAHGRMTEPGTIKAKLEYAAPEQLARARLGVGVDVYGVGITLYELLTQRSPFHRDSPTLTLRAVMQETPPSVARARSEVPRALAQLLQSTMAKSQDERPESARALRLALEACARKAPPVGLPELSAELAMLFPGRARPAQVARVDPDAPTVLAPPGTASAKTPRVGGG